MNGTSPSAPAALALKMWVTMPRLDGLELLKRIKAQKEQAPVIIITGYGTMQTAIKAMQLGAFEYLCFYLGRDMNLVEIEEGKLVYLGKKYQR